MSRIAKPCTLFSTMTGNPGDHIRYLFDGHGMDGNEHRVWTKGIPKTARELSKLGAYWDDVHEKWEEHTVAQAKMTGKQVFIALPNNISEAEIQKVAKAVLKTVPQHLSMVNQKCTKNGNENCTTSTGAILLNRGGERHDHIRGFYGHHFIAPARAQHESHSQKTWYPQGYRQKAY